MRLDVDAWDPGYGTGMEAGGSPDTSSAKVDTDVELPAASWRPLSAPAGASAPGTVLVVDGVRRVDARVWVTDDDGVTHAGLAASYAAGVVRCDLRRGVADVAVTGITLSQEQLKVARRRAEEAGVADRVKFELVDYRAMTGTFDRIVSVGMFEHVGAAHYEEFFQACRRLLKNDGVMLLHTIGRLGTESGPDPFTEKWVFPGYHLPSLSQMTGSSEKVRLIASDVETLRLHYAYTLRAWLERCLAARDKIVALYDERFFRLWEYYLAGGVVMFESGAACNYQVQYIRDRRALPITRDYMAEAEARYRAIDSPR